MTETVESRDVVDRGPFRIRTAAPDDAEALVEYFEGILSDRMASIADLDEMKLDVGRQREHIRRVGARPDALALVAEHEGEIVGFLNMEPGQRRKVGHTVELGMSVREDWRGQGVGQALIEWAENWARSTGKIRKICLNVFSENVAAYKLYEKAGFVVEGKLIDQIRLEDGYQDLILMAKILVGSGSEDRQGKREG